MKKLLLYGLLGTVLFAVSATISLYYLPGKTATPEAGKTAAKTPDTAGKTDDDAHKMKPLVKSAPPDAEQTAQLLQALRDREKAVKEKEDQFAQRRKQMELVYQDIRAERATLDDLRKQIAEEMREVSKKLVEVDRKAGDIDRQKQTMTREVGDMQKRQIDLEATERKNIEKLAKMYENMAPESAARVIQQMADSNRMDTAVKLLSLMKERQAAAILDHLPDLVLAAQITEKMRGVKRVPTSTGTAPTTTPAL